MSEQAPDIEAFTARRFIDFVQDHHKRAVRWSFGGVQQTVPFDYVEFLADGVDGSDEFQTFPPLGRWSMDLRLKPEDGVLRVGYTAPSILVGLENSSLAIRDEAEKLPVLIADYHSSRHLFPYAVNVLLDKMEGPEGAGGLVRPGTRSIVS